jgi:hypothetical protein
MVASSHSGAQARIQQILRTTAAYFALSPLEARPAPRRFLFASEFKDPIPLRWTTSFPNLPVSGRCGVSV